MSSVALNLSRKWRSQNFDQVVGQDLAIRILKNSLYLGHYFPVYLFAGQRGCGKTSTARIFATAINCSALSLFQKDPKKSPIPCLFCSSCIAMREGNHPDFIEIDAASHTGVDNIRSIIESSSLLPLIGQKRVYLIDEAHMLSKAAFNAALKILEEPPTTALFILATTNPHKIIDTVRSRCFQLFFTSIQHNPLKNHLQAICKHEKIACTDEALDLIARHAEGSARDALNLLEQIRFSSSIVNKDAVLLLLGHIDDERVMQLIQLTLQGSPTELIFLLESLHLNQHKAEFIWQRMFILLRALLWIKYGVQPHELVSSVHLLMHHSKLYSINEIQGLIEALYINEELFLKTTMANVYLEMILLDLCAKNKKKNSDDNGSSSSPIHIIVNNNSLNNDIKDETLNNNDSDEVISYENQWEKFVSAVEQLNDPLLRSVFKQARFLLYNKETHHVDVESSKDFIFFKDWLENSQHLWQPLLQIFFSSQVMLDMQFTGIQAAEITKKYKIDENAPLKQSTPIIQHKEKTPSPPRPQEQFRGNNRYSGQKSYIPSRQLYKDESLIDITNENVWKKASMLIRHFPGVITEIHEKQ